MLGAGARAGEPEGYGRTTGGLGSRGVRGIHGTTRSPPSGATDTTRSVPSRSSRISTRLLAGSR